MKNIGRLFALVVVSGLMLLCTILFYRWQAIVAEERAYQSARVELVAQSVENLLLSQELLLDLVARELLKRDDLLTGQAQIPLLDSVIAENPVIVGFGLARPDGTLTRVSSSLDLVNLPNLLTNPATRDSFALALVSTPMVLGRTYSIDTAGDSAPPDTWVIPIRKAIRQQDGTVLAVMTAGIGLKDEQALFGQTLHDNQDDSVWLYREADGYIQFMSREGVGPETYSQITLAENQLLSNRQQLEQILRQNNDNTGRRRNAIVAPTFKDGSKYLTAVSFNDRYQLWVVSETRYTPLYQAFLSSVLVYSIISLFIGLAFFKVFKVIDNAERKRQDELLYTIRHDTLTGLFNRKGLLDCLGEKLPDQKPFTLILLNMDNFKGINGRFGLEAGDAALNEFGRLLKTMISDDDILSRLGGDEFAIVTDNTDPDQVRSTCVSLLNRLAGAINVGRFQMYLSVSVGAASFPEHGQSLSEVLRSAHLGLSEAKESRNAICFYRPDMKNAYLRRLAVEQRLRIGLQDNALFMMYQPQVDERQRTTGIEALVRWIDTELGPVSPEEIVKIAESSGLMVTLGKYVLEMSVREYSKLLLDTGYSLDLAINVSVIQIRQPDFVALITNTLEVHNVSPKTLVLEITETLLMSHFDQVQDTIVRLRELGIRISMDDFGTGYSSLSLLRKLPFDELKIDKSFVDHVLQDGKAAKMIRSIIAIANSHDLDVIAEGVESKAQAQALSAMGCHRYQGYYFSRPELLGTLRERMRASRDESY
jgi:diguanylate cyclase (GGDEF)-like protein